MWNSFHGLAQKLGQENPAEPLYFLKAPNSFLAGDAVIRRPRAYSGKVFYEGELGIVIGKRCGGVSEAEAAGHSYGYTCINDTGFAQEVGLSFRSELLMLADSISGEINRDRFSAPTD